MDIPKIEAKRTWDKPGLEKLMAKCKFYSESPERIPVMMDFISKSEPTYEAMYRVAVDIQRSTKKAVQVCEIMSILEKNAVTTEFEIKAFNPFNFD